MSVISCIDDQLTSLLPDPKKNKVLVKNLVSSSCRLLKSVAPVLAKAAATKLIGPDGVSKIGEEINSENEKVVTEIVGKVTGELIKNNKKAEKSIEDFQGSLKALVDALTTDSGKPNGSDPLKPLFIFIDELDRCRPLYAIELLERIKHLFGISGIVFVIATDTEQLQHSVKAIYGDGFDSGVYLRRFFNQSYTLPVPDFVDYAKLLFRDFKPNGRFSSYSISTSGDSPHDSHNSNYEKTNEHTLKINNTEFSSQHDLAELILLFALFSAFFKIDLRTQNQCYEKLLAIISFIPEHEKIQFPYLVDPEKA